MNCAECKHSKIRLVVDLQGSSTAIPVRETTCAAFPYSPLRYRPAVDLGQTVLECSGFEQREKA